MELEQTTVPGLGNEVLWTFGLLVATGLTLGILWNVFGSSERDQRVHPEQQETVDRAREHVRDERDGHAPPNNNDNSADIVQCPVCLGSINYPVDTNCGHRFCAQCVLAYWHADRWPRTCRCPVCRREVTLLLSDPIFERNELFQDLSRQVIDYNQRMSGQWRPLLSYIYDIPTLLRHLWTDLFTVGGLLCIHRLHIFLVLALLLLYIILPLDILPESFLGMLGFIDDILIVLGVLVYVTLVYRAYITHRQMTDL